MNPNVTIDGMGGKITSNGMVSFQADDRVNVQFYKKSVLDPVKSRENGRPFHVSKDYVRIQQPGEKDYADRPVSDDESVKFRWPQHWARYEANQQQVPAGTPVDLLFPATPEIPANLHQLGVHTVEQLAHLTSEGISQVGMGATQWHTMAREYLKQAQAGVGHHQLQKELADRDNKLEVQGHQIALLQSQLEKLMAERQGVPQAMIPQAAPQYQALSPLPPSAFETSSEDDDAEASEAELSEPKRRGRPPKNKDN